MLLLSEQEIYTVFRRVQSASLGRPYRLPKNWETFYNKWHPKRKAFLTEITKRFNTRWSNIDPKFYFECGFKVFPLFSYHNFLDRRVINLYIAKDRLIKREGLDPKEDLITSISYVDSSIPEGKTSKLYRYLNSYTENRRRIIADYLANRVGKYFLVYLMATSHIKLSESELIQLPYIREQYHRYKKEINDCIRRQDFDINEIFKGIL